MSTWGFEKITFHETAPDLESGVGQEKHYTKPSLGLQAVARATSCSDLQAEEGGRFISACSFFSGVASDLQALGCLDAETDQLCLNHAINEIGRHADTVLG